MSPPRLHPDEVEIGTALARRLVDSRFPLWRDLPLKRVASSGTDNAIFRLGPDLCLRLPRYPAAAALLGKEQLWLPRLASHLPLAIPVPLATAPPGEGYPFAWSVCRWIPGEDAHGGTVRDRDGAAWTLARFIQALQAIDPSEGPRSGSVGVERGVPLVERDERVRQATSMSSRSCGPGTKPWPPRPGADRPSGCMATCTPATCWCARARSSR